jgi:hypothetical protein
MENEISICEFDLKVLRLIDLNRLGDIHEGAAKNEAISYLLANRYIRVEIGRYIPTMKGAATLSNKEKDLKS